MNRRLAEVTTSASIMAKEKADELKLKGIDIIDLSIGDPDFPTPIEVKRSAIAAIESNKTHYTNSSGIKELREQVENFLVQKKRLEAGTFSYEKNMLITPGSKQGIYYILDAILENGDEVVVPEPSWLSYKDIIRLNGGIPVPIGTTEKTDFIPTIESIENSITPKTRAILINNPVNPTGAIYKKNFLQDLIDLCEKKDTLLVSDEIYSDIIFDGAFDSALGFGSKHVAMVSGFSKSAAMTGWRVGYLIADKKIIDPCLKIQQQTATCPSSISQYAAIAAYKHHDTYFPKMLVEYCRRLKVLLDGLTSSKIRCFTPKGAFYVFMDIRKTGISSSEAVNVILDKAHVCTVSGSEYGKSGEGYVRLSFAAETKRLTEAANRINEVFQ